MDRKEALYCSATLVSVLLIIGTIVAGGLMIFGNWHEYNYTIEMPAAVQFSRAMRTNNIDLFANYTEAGLAYYEDYTGNPGWLVQYDDTDWETIKNDLRDVIATARIAANNSEIGSDAYEEALLSGQDSLSILQDSLNRNLGLEWLHPRKSWAVWAWGGVFIGFIILAGLFWWQWDDYSYYHRYN